MLRSGFESPPGHTDFKCKGQMNKERMNYLLNADRDVTVRVDRTIVDTNTGEEIYGKD